MILAGLLLAGGASSRFGTEKAVAPFGDGLLMDMPLAALTGACALVAVSARPGAKAAAVAAGRGHVVLQDPKDAPSGPLAGILSGLAWAAAEGASFLATAPCDAPTLRADQIAALAVAARTSCGAAAAASPNGVEPLVAVWPVTEGLTVVGTAMSRGDHPSVRSALASVGLTPVQGFDGINFNHADDLRDSVAELVIMKGCADRQDEDLARLFAFEADFVGTLRCIPMCVRFKLDRSQIKLSLRQWSCFSRDDREELRLKCCGTRGEIAAYRGALEQLVRDRSQEAVTPLAVPPEPVWRTPSLPEIVADFARSRGVRTPTDATWSALSELQRYVLVKLARDKHDNANFVPAMRELGLLA